MPHPIRHIRGPEDFAAAFGVSRETIDRLTVYAALLQQWQKTINLVGPATLDDIWHRHFADSAQLLALAPAARTWVDLGSGAGLPGLVIAILLADKAGRIVPSPLVVEGQGGGASPSPRSPSGHPHTRAIRREPEGLRGEGRGEGRHKARTVPVSAPHPNPLPMPEGAWGEGTPCVTLIESNARKCAFLREVVRQTGLSGAAHTGVAVDILSIRIENAATQTTLQAPEIVSARALAPLDQLLELAAPLFASHTTGLFLKGRDAAKELETAQGMWDFRVELVQSCTEHNGCVVVVRRLGPKHGGMKP